MSTGAILFAVLLSMPAEGPSERDLDAGVEGLPRPERSEDGESGLPDVSAISCESAEEFGGTAMEQAAWCYAQRRRFVSVRTLASRALNLNPQSIHANFLLGLALHQGEGNLPRALYFLERAESLFVERFGVKPNPNLPIAVYLYVLRELVFVHGEMDHHEEKIRYIDALESRLDLDYAPLKAWPLLKLKRFDEARRVALEATQSEDEWYRAVGLTALCAVESEMRNRQAAYEACVRAAEPVLSSTREGSVELSNAGAAAEEMYRFDEAERYLLEATRRPPEGAVNPWGRLTRLYLRQGRFAEAVDAWREMREYRRRRPASYLNQQDQAESDLTGAAVLILAGRAADALAITERTIHRPDRQGTSSAASEQNEAGAAIMNRMVMLEVARTLEEEACSSRIVEALRLRARAIWLRINAWVMERHAADLLADRDRLVSTLRPECPGSMEAPTWLDGEVIAVVGPGVAMAAIEEARRQETLPGAIAEPVFAALRAEALLLGGAYDQALSEAVGALEAMPRAEALSRARVALVAAESLRRLGRIEESLRYFELGLKADPGAVRRMGFSLPVVLRSLDESPEVQVAVDYLGRSPLLDASDFGFELRVSSLVAVLASPDGNELMRIPMPSAQASERDDAGRRIARVIHRDLLVPNVDITQADIRSLDGSMGSGGRASQRVNSVLEDVLEGGRAPR